MNPAPMAPAIIPYGCDPHTLDVGDVPREIDNAALGWFHRGRLAPSAGNACEQVSQPQRAHQAGRRMFLDGPFRPVIERHDARLQLFDTPARPIVAVTGRSCCPSCSWLTVVSMPSLLDVLLLNYPCGGFRVASRPAGRQRRTPGHGQNRPLPNPSCQSSVREISFCNPRTDSATVSRVLAISASARTISGSRTLVASSLAAVMD